MKTTWRRNVPISCLPDEVLGEALIVAFQTDMLDPSLIERLQRFPVSELYPIWKNALQEAASGSRASFCENLEVMSPLIVRLGGVDALAHTFGNLGDMTRWWP